jgi:flagellar assembly protein FliH
LFSKVIKKDTCDFEIPVPIEINRPRRIIPADEVIIDSAESPISPPDEWRDSASLPDSTESPESSGQLSTPPIDSQCSPDDVALVNSLVEERVRAFEQRFQDEKELAYKDGYSQGKTRGYQEGISVMQKIEDLLNEIHNDIKSHHESFTSRAGEILGKLALEIAQTVIGEAVMKSSKGLFEHNLKRCLDILAGSGEVRIRINPAEYEYAREFLQAVKPRDGDRFSFEFEPDPTITPGGCFIETSNGAIDARIESQFEQIKDNFLQLV